MATATANLKHKRKPRPASMRSSMAFSITSPLDSPLQSSREAKWTSLCAFCFCFCFS